MGKVIWTVPALKDLHDIIEHIAEDSPIYAERFGIQVVESPRRLEQFPYCGRIVPEFKVACPLFIYNVLNGGSLQLA